MKGSRVIVVVGFALALFAAPAQAATNPKPVPSLQPAATAQLWTKLVHQRHAFTSQAAADCRPLRAVFYTTTDWLRLSTKLAASGSACAQYYVSIPPLAADKTAFRTDQAWRIRALGPNFHAVAEINVSGWTTWVTNNGGSWYAAGLEARRRMAAAGFDVTAGDTWIVNEFSSAVRRGDGTARQSMRDLVHGLYDGDGSLPVAKGGVFISGMAQSTADPSVYKTNLENWLQDTGFWTDMNAYVSDWSQELYGDVRNYAVAGTSPQDRGASLDDYLEHILVHANAGPDGVAAARSFLQATYSPLANAAWRYQSAFGWTDVPYDQMEDYVSAQTYALRSFQAKIGQAEDHLGFAWALSNLNDIDPTEFANETGTIADRLAAAIHDSAQPVDPSDPGIGACLPNWCSTVVSGAAFATQWKTFQTWPQPALSYSSAPVSVTAGSPSSPITVQLPSTESASVTVTLVSSSPQGTFSVSAGGPWASTLSVTIPGGSTTASFYYEDTKTGSPTLTASASGHTSASQAETVTPAPPAAMSISPASATVPLGGSQTFTASGADAYGNAVPVTPSWSVGPGTPGTVSPATGSSTTFTPSGAGSGSVVATSGTVTASASVVVTAPKVRVKSIAYKLRSDKRLVVTITVVRSSDGVALAGATVSFTLSRGTTTVSSPTATTDSAGQTKYFTPSKAQSGCYTTTIGSVSASGFTWDGVTPANQYCF